MEKKLSDEAKLNNNVPPAVVNIKDSNTSTVEEIVLPDECGDSLWDGVLAQKEEPLSANNNYAVGALLNKINDVQVCLNKSG